MLMLVYSALAYASIYNYWKKNSPHFSASVYFFSYSLMYLCHWGLCFVCFNSVFGVVNRMLLCTHSFSCFSYARHIKGKNEKDKKNKREWGLHVLKTWETCDYHAPTLENTCIFLWFFIFLFFFFFFFDYETI